jgi:hypothetical protein
VAALPLLNSARRTFEGGATMEDTESFEKMADAEIDLQSRLNEFKKLCDNAGVEFRDRVEDLIYNAENEK